MINCKKGICVVTLFSQVESNLNQFVWAGVNTAIALRCEAKLYVVSV